jgi:hypothetical protein
LIKAQIPDQILVNWFTKSLLPPIPRDVAMGGMVTEEQAISHAQYLDLIYYQSGTLYDLIPNAPRPTNDPSSPTPKPHADGTIGLVSTPSSSTSTSHKKSSTSSPTTVSNVSDAKSTPPSGQSSEVNSVDSSQFRGKKKNTNNKGKGKQSSNDQEVINTQELDAAGSKQKKKAKYSCMICVEDHYTKYYPHNEEITRFWKGNSQPAVL